MITSIPTWAAEAGIALIKAAANLIGAKSDDEREEALMQAAEAHKAALDKKKFGV